MAEDVAQDALALTWDRWESVDEAHREAWTYRVAFNRCRSLFRRRVAERKANRTYAATERDGRLDGIGARAVVVAALARLTRRQREAVLARYYLGFDVRGTAELLGCAPGTVTALTSQALSRLQAAGIDRSALELEDQRHA
jgi:RNA polymerase sigma factor (sigma-70 family)